VLNQVLDVSLLVENAVLNWSRSVNDELLSSLSVLGGLDSLLAYRTIITIHTYGDEDKDSIARDGFAKKFYK